jgi:hypothetical protein
VLTLLCTPTYCGVSNRQFVIYYLAREFIIYLVINTPSLIGKLHEPTPHGQNRRLKWVLHSTRQTVRSYGWYSTSDNFTRWRYPLTISRTWSLTLSAAETNRLLPLVARHKAQICWKSYLLLASGHARHLYLEVA